MLPGPRCGRQKRRAEGGGWLQQWKTESHTPEPWRAGGIGGERVSAAGVGDSQRRGHVSLEMVRWVDSCDLGRKECTIERGYLGVARLPHQVSQAHPGPVSMKALGDLTLDAEADL